MVKAVIRKMLGMTPTSAKSTAFGIAYWMGTKMATGRMRIPTRRNAFSGSSRNRRS